MAVSFFIPKKINVGFQNRQGTYTGKLAYVVCFGENGKLRKEKSWNGWRDKDIENEIYDNEPTSGFVLNKKAGGYNTGWNHRQTYVRVYDPRGFEFEINVTNLLYILENTNSIKGKGLEGEFVYGWDGKDLVLIPVDSPDYVELKKLNELRHAKKKIGARDLKIGATYLSKDNKELVYVGKFDEYSYSGVKSSKPKFFFYNSESQYSEFVTMPSVSQRILDVVSEEYVSNYADIVDKLERSSIYSPIDKEATKYHPYTKEEIFDKIKDSRWKFVYTEQLGEFHNVSIGMSESGEFNFYKFVMREERRWIPNNGYVTKEFLHKANVKTSNFDEMFGYLKPLWKQTFLKNGKLYREEI